MTLYTGFIYRMMQAKPYVTRNMYEKLYEQKRRLGQTIRIMCTTGYTDSVITRRQCRIFKEFFIKAVNQLHHCVEEIEEYSTEIIPEDSKRLKSIRKIYESFKIERKYVYFYDEILKENIRISIDSPDLCYAIIFYGLWEYHYMVKEILSQ